MVASPAQFLVVSPDGTVREAAQRCLQSLGHIAFAAPNVTRAGRTLARIEVDAMCLDTLLAQDQLDRFWRSHCAVESRPRPSVILLAPLSAAAVPSTLPPFYEPECHALAQKPIELEDFARAVARALSGRTHRARSAELLRAGSVMLDVATHQLLFIDGGVLALTPMESRLLACLMRRPGEYISPQELLEEVWGYPPGLGGPEVVRSHVSNVRKKLRSLGGGPDLLRTIPYQGYGFVAESASAEISIQ